MEIQEQHNQPMALKRVYQHPTTKLATHGLMELWDSLIEEEEPISLRDIKTITHTNKI